MISTVLVTLLSVMIVQALRGLTSTQAYAEGQTRVLSLAERVVQEIRSRAFQFVVLNIANPDMVGHTGVMPAAVAAVEATDEAIGRSGFALGFVVKSHRLGNVGMNLPNICTLSRIPLMFAIVALMYTQWLGAATLTFVLFVIAGVTDFLDGHFARKLGQVTNFGVHYMDAIHWALGQDAPLAVTAMLPIFEERASSLSRVPSQSGHRVKVTARSTKARMCGCIDSRSLARKVFCSFGISPS